MNICCVNLSVTQKSFQSWNVNFRVTSIEMVLKTTWIHKFAKGEYIQSTKGNSDLSLGPLFHCKPEEEDLRSRRETQERDHWNSGEKGFENTTSLDNIEKLVQRCFVIAFGFGRVVGIEIRLGRWNRHQKEKEDSILLRNLDEMTENWMIVDGGGNVFSRVERFHIL